MHLKLLCYDPLQENYLQAGARCELQSAPLQTRIVARKSRPQIDHLLLSMSTSLLVLSAI